MIVPYADEVDRSHFGRSSLLTYPIKILIVGNPVILSTCVVDGVALADRPTGLAVYDGDFRL